MKTLKPLTIAALLIAPQAMAQTPAPVDLTPRALMRERLAACATQWQQMKRTGTEGDLIWREFSKICLDRQARSQAQTPLKKENASPVR